MWHSIKSHWVRWTIIIFGSVSLIKILLTHDRRIQRMLVPTSESSLAHKPEGVTVRALVFYGRRDRAEILQCYLERNLVDRGGWLDEVVWVLNTTVHSDINYLHQILDSQPRYRIQPIPSDGLGTGFRHAYDSLEPSSIYIKIDDDVIWIGQTTIPRLVIAKLKHPEYLAISANVINSPTMSKIQGDRGAHRPYLPALFQNTTMLTNSWDYTHYPFWQGPPGYNLTWEEWVDPKVPWLQSLDISATPIVDVESHPWGNALTDWKLGYQALLSLLQNLRDGTLSSYYHNTPDFHSTTGTRMSINLIAIQSDDVLLHLPIEGDDEDDEHWLTVSLPKRLSKQIVVENRALAAHLSSSYQHHLDKSDALARFADYAKYLGCHEAEKG